MGAGVTISGGTTRGRGLAEGTTASASGASVDAATGEVVAIPQHVAPAIGGMLTRGQIIEHMQVAIVGGQTAVAHAIGGQIIVEQQIGRQTTEAPQVASTGGQTIKGQIIRGQTIIPHRFAKNIGGQTTIPHRSASNIGGQIIEVHMIGGQTTKGHITEAMIGGQTIVLVHTSGEIHAQ